MNLEVDNRANEILNLFRNKLLVKLRFMDVALSFWWLILPIFMLL